MKITDFQPDAWLDENLGPGWWLACFACRGDILCSLKKPMVLTVMLLVPMLWAVPANTESELAMPFALSTEASEQEMQEEVHKCLQTRTRPLDMESSQEEGQTVLLEMPWEGEQRCLSRQPLQHPGIWEGPSWAPGVLAESWKNAQWEWSRARPPGTCSAEWVVSHTCWVRYATVFNEDTYSSGM